MSVVSDRVWDFASKAAMPACVVLASVLITHEIRLSKIEATRFALSDAHRLRSEIESDIEKRYPPKWLRQKVQHIEQVLDRIEHRIHELEKAR